MPLFSVIIPTYNHCDTILWAIKSVQEQTLQDFEIIVVGDGVPDRTRDIMMDFCKKDKRIVFRDNPKGESKGEVHRHQAILAAKGKYIAYIADDDLWYKTHLEILEKGLTDNDFCNTLHSCVYPNGTLKIFAGDIGQQYCRNILSRLKFNFFGPTCVGHRRVSYQRLASGWSPAPTGEWTDLHMWRKWIADEKVRFCTLPILTTIHLDSPGREEMTIAERAAESEAWLEKIRDPYAFAAIELNAFRQQTLALGGFQFMAHHYKHEFDKLQQAQRLSMKKRR